MEKFKTFMTTLWKRMTSSKVAWLSLPMACAQVWLAVSGEDVSERVNVVFSALWAVLGIFLATNNPADKENF